MENINPQYTLDHTGKPVEVFSPIEGWNAIAQKLNMDLPQWQKEMLDTRLAQYRQNPTALLDWDTIASEFDKEDEAL